MQTRRELFFAPFQRLAVIAEQWRAGSKSYLTDLASIALLLLPLTLSNALAILLGHAFRVAGLGDVSLLLFHLSDILINLYPTAFCVVAAYYLSHKANVSSVVLIIYSLIMFYLVSIENESLSATYTLPNNSLLALISAMMSYLYCKHLRIQLLEPQALDFTSRLFKDVLHFFVFVLVAVSLSHVTAAIMV